VLADLPGLIEGAHEGAGLGHRFLGHAERCRVLIHLVDGANEDVADAYRTIRKELAAYSPILAAKPEILCLNKCDALGPDEIKHKCAALARAAKLKKSRGKNSPPPVAAISGATGQGVKDLMRAAFAIVAQTREAEAAEQSARGPSYDPPTRSQDSAADGQSRRLVVRSARLLVEERGIRRMRWATIPPGCAKTSTSPPARSRSDDGISGWEPVNCVWRKSRQRRTGQIRLAHAYQRRWPATTSPPPRFC
jgi:hypothetical protein